MVGRCHQHYVHILTVEHTAEVLHGIGMFSSLLLANLKCLAEHGVIYIAENGAINFRIEEEAFEIAATHPAATDQAQTDFLIRTRFTRPSGADEGPGNSS